MLELELLLLEEEEEEEELEELDSFPLLLEEEDITVRS